MLLQAGDLVWVVLTDREFHRRNDTAIVCPITSNKAPWPSKVVLPDGLAARGAILVDQIRMLDRTQRGFRSVGRVPEEVLNEVRAKLAALLGINFMAFERGSNEPRQ